MKNEARTIITSTIFILLFGMISNVVINNGSSADYYGAMETAEGSWACTADAKICPDGSAVGRIPPYCQFANCPD